jgi:hypothetical protein
MGRGSSGGGRRRHGSPDTSRRVVIEAASPEGKHGEVLGPDETGTQIVPPSARILSCAGDPRIVLVERE